MLKIEWVVETGEVFLDGRDLANAIEARGGKVHRIYGRAPHLAWPRIEGGSIPLGFGSCNFILMMSRQPTLCEGVLDSHSDLRCSNYYHYVYDLIKGPRIFMPHGALKHAVPELKKIFGDKVFVRPDAAIKQFDGQVFDTDKLAEADTDIRLSRSKESMVVLGQVQSFDKEYRVFCRNGKAFGHSSYIPLDKEWEPAPKEVVELAETVAKRLLDSVRSMVVVDIGETKTEMFDGDPRSGSFAKIGDGPPEFSLIEINGVNSSGFYGCDLNAFIEAMEAEARVRYPVDQGL